MTIIHYYKNTNGKEHLHLRDGPILEYCPICHHCAVEFIHYSGSRYGQGPAYNCSSCSSRIQIVDGDGYPPITYHVVHELETGIRTEIDYSVLYGFSARHLRAFEAKTQLSIVNWDDQSQVIEFDDVVDLAAAKVTELWGEVTPFQMTHPILSRIPEVFSRWRSLLYTVDLDSEK